MRQLLRFTAVCVIITAISLPIKRLEAGTIDTASTWNGTGLIGALGEFNTGTFGQTFTVSAGDEVLESFTVFVDDNEYYPDVVDFAFYLAQWDGNKAIGPVLFQSSMVSTTNNGGADGFEQFTFHTGGLLLTAGTQYVGMLSASQFFDGVAGTSVVGRNEASNAYAGGAFVWHNNGADFGRLFTETWDNHQGNNGFDMAYIAEFSNSIAAVPEPSTFALLGIGGLALVGYGWRRRRSQGRCKGDVIG